MQSNLLPCVSDHVYNKFLVTKQITVKWTINAVYYMDISVLPETKTLVVSIFSVREIWRALRIKGPGCVRALWFAPFVVLPLLVCSSQWRLLDSLLTFPMTI